VVSDEFETIIDGETRFLEEGDSFYRAAQKSHRAVCKKAGTRIGIISPLRYNFLGEEK
jgi:quercetin dioxygenase-like cupin family protein